MRRALAVASIGLALLGSSLSASGAPAAHAVRPDAALALVDDRGRTLRFERPPTRIVSLAPHATELLFAAGAGSRVVAVDPYSDQPPQARALARVTAHPAPDPEQLLALAPDLVVVWGASASPDRVEQLRALGLAVFVSEPRTLDAIADGIERFAALSADPSAGIERARRFRLAVAALRARHAQSVPVPVFVQAWARPLLTLSDRDTIGDALRSCGARNVFGAMPTAAPLVGVEAVLAASPRLIVAIDDVADRSRWDALGLLRPQGAIAFARIDPSIQRPAARILDALEQLCAAVDAVR